MNYPIYNLMYAEKVSGFITFYKTEGEAFVYLDVFVRMGEPVESMADAHKLAESLGFQIERIPEGQLKEEVPVEIISEAVYHQNKVGA